MDIKLPIAQPPQTAPIPSKDNPLALKIGQPVDAAVTRINEARTGLTLRIGDTTLLVQSNQALLLEPGQSVKLVVSRLFPQIEFQFSDKFAATYPKTSSNESVQVTLSVVKPGGGATESAAPSRAQATGDMNAARVPTPGEAKISLPTQFQMHRSQGGASASSSVLGSTAPMSSSPLGEAITARVLAVGDGKIQLQLQLQANQTPRAGAVFDFAEPVAKSRPSPTGEMMTARILTVSDVKAQLQIQALISQSKPGAVNRPIIELPIAQAEARHIKPGQPVILEFHRQNSTSESRMPAAALRDIPAIVRHFLPKHESPTVLIDHLIDNQSVLQRSENVSEALKRLARQILEALPRRDQLFESGPIKQAIRNSGLFLEAQLAGQMKPNELSLSEDFKGLLLKLAHSLKTDGTPQTEIKQSVSDQELVKNLLQKAESSIAKLVLDQVGSLPKEDAPKQVWLLEIPFIDDKNARSVQIEIERDKSGNQRENTDKNWSVTMTISPPNLGKLHCKLSYLDRKINAHFWSEQASVTRLIKQNLDHLKQQLEAEGLAAGFLDALDGTPPRKASDGDWVGKKGLLNEKA
ncbi:MAG: flagellar hook-length control protein FliK [Methylomicrobium sp.]